MSTEETARLPLGFRLAYIYLTLGFLFPSLAYLCAPGTALAQFDALGVWLGGGHYAFWAGEQGYVWRVLAAANVMTLAFMCGLILFDIRRFYPVLYPLVFMKSTTALAYLWIFLFAYHYPAFLAVALYDGFCLFLMIYFAGRAQRALSETRPCRDIAGVEVPAC